MYWLYPSQKKKQTQKQTERKTHNTQGREGGLQIHPTNQIQRNTSKKPNKNIWSLFTYSKIKGTYKSRESIGWKWQSFTDRQQRNHFINMPFSHLLLWRDALPKFAASPKKMLIMYLVTGSSGKIPTTNAIQLSQNRVCVCGVSSTDLKLFLSFFFFFSKDVKLSTPIIRNKLPLGLYLLLQLQGLREGQKEKI